MTENKRGGKREGAGRPKQEKTKKQVTFRLSEDELKAIKDLLAKMRNKLALIFLLLALCAPCFAADIKQEAFKGVYRFCPLPNTKALSRASFNQEIKQDTIKSMQRQSNGLIEIVYKDMPNFAFNYKVKKDTPFAVGGFYCQTVMVDYGNKAALYDASTNRLIAVRYTRSSTEEYYYDMNGNLFAEKQGDKLYKYKADLKAIQSAMYFGR